MWIKKYFLSLEITSKKLLLATFFLASAVNAQACDVIFSSSSPDVMEVVSKNGFGFNDYKAICKKLNSNNARLIIDGQATVIDSSSIAWASVGVGDKNLPIYTKDFGGSSIRVNPFASIDTAKVALGRAINFAVDEVDFDKAINALDKSRKIIKSAYK